ncbi:kinase-like protein [Gigaspora margarita]|uniref:Kinase-like protein n=1 Tax=Gigaspora margarita TaxID=4874 RepID=A0A8H4B5C4_GIGMA|nr:kinase-like protein [Gigaspora margarita]
MAKGGSDVPENVLGTRKVYTLCNKKKTSNQYTRPDWTTHPEKTGKLLCSIPPITLAEVKDEYYFINSSFIEQEIFFKLPPSTISIGDERHADFAFVTILEGLINQ